MYLATIDPVSDYTYTGVEICPELNVYFIFEYEDGHTSTKEFELGEDYTVSFENNIVTGTAKINLTGIGNCSGSNETTFNIIPKNATLICDDVTVSYGDIDHELTVSSDDLAETDTLVLEQDYNIERVSGYECGDYKITATIIPSGDVANVSYDFPSGAHKEFAKGIDYLVTYSDNIDAGTATISIAGTGNCSPESTSSTLFIINRAQATASCDNKEVIYGQNPKYTLTTNGVVAGEILKYDEDFSVSGVGEDVGTYNFSANIYQNGPVSKNYIFSDVESGTLTISTFNFENAEVAAIDPIAYTGSEITPDFFVSYTFPEMQNSLDLDNTKVFDEGKDYYVTYENNINVRIATATLHGKNNCQNDKKVTFQIVGSLLDGPNVANGISPTGDNMLFIIIVRCILVISLASFIYSRRKKLFKYKA